MTIEERFPYSPRPGGYKQQDGGQEYVNLADVESVEQGEGVVTMTLTNGRTIVAKDEMIYFTDRENRVAYMGVKARIEYYKS